MNSQQIRDRWIGPYLNQNQSKITYVLSNIQSGGWEGWLQVELATYILKSIRNGSFSREQNYYQGSNAKYDLLIKPFTGTNIYFEIKTQSEQSDYSTANRMKNDIIKIKNLSSDFKRNSVIISFAVTALSNSRELSNFVQLMHNPNFRRNLSAYNLEGVKLENFVPNNLTLVWYTIDF